MRAQHLLPPFRPRVAWVFGDQFDVDQVIGVANIKVQDLEQLAELAMKNFEPDFREKVRPGDVLVGGRNFGYGHPHAVAMKAMRRVGIKAVIAESFFSSFWIGEIGQGFIQIVCPRITGAVQRWDHLNVDFVAGTVTVERTGEILPFTPYSDRDATILAAGGLRPLLQRG
jgi:3-isopropylmalate/(R)-2-methylmalate dehydratase small subunit